MASRCGLSRQKPAIILHHRSFLPSRSGYLTYTRHYSSRRSLAPLINNVEAKDLADLLAEPSWTIESLLPPKSQAPNAPKITSQQLNHLIRLSALPPPETPEAEQKMLDTLSAQLHFVGEIQQVDTTGVKPLRAVRDETPAAEEEQTITLETLKDALAKEEVIGKHYKRIQRKTTPVDTKDVEDWDILGSAQRKVGKYFVVESQRPQE